MASLLLAQSLMFLSAALASIGSLDINDLVLTQHEYHWTQMLLSNGVIGSLICILYWAGLSCKQRCEGEPRLALFGKKENVPWLVARGVSGGIAMSCAFLAMSYIDMASANVVMFTNPVWTGFFAWLVIGQRWSWYDKVLCVVAFIGVVLVARPPPLFHPPRPPPFHPPPPPPHVPPHGTPPPGVLFESLARPPPQRHRPPPAPWQIHLGLGAALACAILLSVSSLIINTKLKGKEKPNTVSLYLFLGVIAVDLPFLFVFTDPKSMVTQHSLMSVDTYLFLGVGIVFYGFQYLRSWALLISNNASVVNLLYAEIAFAFLWGTTILHQKLFWSSALGAVLIVVGCLVVSKLKSRDASRSPPITTQDAPVNNGRLLSKSGGDESTCSGGGGEDQREGPAPSLGGSSTNASGADQV